MSVGYRKPRTRTAGEGLCRVFAGCSPRRGRGWPARLDGLVDFVQWARSVRGRLGRFRIA